jgi:hypothetical protein
MWEPWLSAVKAKRKGSRAIESREKLSEDVARAEKKVAV